ncbi:MAG: membrane protein insertase YidC [Henriciella sp.]
MMNQKNGMDPQDQRNFIIAMVLMIAFVFIYQSMILDPAAKRAEEARVAAEAANPAPAGELGDTALLPSEPQVAATVEEALVRSERVIFDADRVDGSIRLTGAVIDDLSLKDHYKTIERNEELRLLRPASAEHGFYASWYWTESGKIVAGNADVWTLKNSGELSTNTPITLELVDSGLTFNRTISVDENYLFTFTDSITNNSTEARALAPLGRIRRHGEWKQFLEATDPGSSKKTGLVHQGLVGVLDDRLKLRNYKNLAKGKTIKGKGESDARPGTFPSPAGGWIGFTDMYWMAALVPEQDRAFDARFDQRMDNSVFEVTARAAPMTLAPGETKTVANQIFAGAKEYKVVKDYTAAGLPRFDDAIDWGSFEYYISRPFFALLNWLNGKLGSFGLGILALVVLIKIPLIPLYNSSYKSMAKMKKLTEPMKDIQERFKADPQRKQQEIMALYKREKANPVAGCVPILFTIPVFFALYKILYVTIEMRHTSFLHLTDLSAPDPTAIGNLFGLMPWAAADVKSIPLLGFIIGIGILPILYGVTMAAIQSLSPPPPDPTQRTIMMALPIVFMFVFGSFASGLVLYWVWNNILSLIQQYIIMRRNGVDTQLDTLIKYLRNRNKPKPNEE